MGLLSHGGVGKAGRIVGAPGVDGVAGMMNDTPLGFPADLAGLGFEGRRGPVLSHHTH